MAADPLAARLPRRPLLRLAPAALLAGCDTGKPWHTIDVTGTSPALAFTMQRAPDGNDVDQATYRGHTTLLYFGYTFCPDVCPLTLQNIGQVLGQMGPSANGVRVLFVTVDPGRDDLATLGRYCAAFGPEIVGLRGTTDQIARLARRYRIAYSVTPAAPATASGTDPATDPATSGATEDVTHSAAVYVFDRAGAARLLVPSLANADPDINGTAADLTRLIQERPLLPAWLARLV